MNKGTTFDKNFEEYDLWFDEHEKIYQAELESLKRLIPQIGLGIEIGVGTGRFSVPFGIGMGVEPSKNMALIAGKRGISVCQALGEHLPFSEDQFDFALLVTVVCFVKDVAQLLFEGKRVIKVGGQVIVGFVDKESALGQFYLVHKDSNKFYREAYFYSTQEIVTFMQQVGLGQMQSCQTIFGLPGSDEAIYQVRSGAGEGAFVAISAKKF